MSLSPKMWWVCSFLFFRLRTFSASKKKYPLILTEIQHPCHFLLAALKVKPNVSFFVSANPWISYLKEMNKGSHICSPSLVKRHFICRITRWKCRRKKPEKRNWMHSLYLCMLQYIIFLVLFLGFALIFQVLLIYQTKSKLLLMKIRVFTSYPKYLYT